MQLSTIHCKKIQPILKKKRLNIYTDNYVTLSRQMRKLLVESSTSYSSQINDTTLGEVGRYRMNKKLGLDIRNG